jgi:hypothetical protein
VSIGRPGVGEVVPDDSACSTLERRGALVPEGLVALTHGLAKSDLHRMTLEVVALDGVTRDPVQERAERLRLVPIVSSQFQAPTRVPTSQPPSAPASRQQSASSASSSVTFWERLRRVWAT